MVNAIRASRLSKDIFTHISTRTIHATGERWGFLTAIVIIILWAFTGPLFRYSENWQLVINTGTSVVTFLMVFLIQNAQNRESTAIHLKLDELILSVQQARNELIDVEHLTAAELDKLAIRYRKVAESNQEKLIACLEGDETEVCVETN